VLKTGEAIVVNDILGFLLSWLKSVESDVPGIILIVSSLAIVPFLLPLRATSLVATLALISSAGVLWVSTDRLLTSILLIGSAALLASVEGLLIRRRIENAERRLIALSEKVQGLETTHERYQALLARRLPPAAKPDNKNRSPQDREARGVNGSAGINVAGPAVSQEMRGAATMTPDADS
jgi:hypothetical protein